MRSPPEASESLVAAVWRKECDVAWNGRRSFLRISRTIRATLKRVRRCLPALLGLRETDSVWPGSRMMPLLERPVKTLSYPLTSRKAGWLLLTDSPGTFFFRLSA